MFSPRILASSCPALSPISALIDFTSNWPSAGVPSSGRRRAPQADTVRVSARENCRRPSRLQQVEPADDDRGRGRTRHHALEIRELAFNQTRHDVDVSEDHVEAVNAAVDDHRQSRCGGQRSCHLRQRMRGNDPRRARCRIRQEHRSHRKPVAVGSRQGQNTAARLAATTTFAALLAWNQFLLPLLFAQSANVQPVSMLVGNFVDPSRGAQWGPLSAVASVSVLPILLFSLLLQKYLLK